MHASCECTFATQIYYHFVVFYNNVIYLLTYISRTLFYTAISWKYCMLLWRRTQLYFLETGSGKTLIAVQLMKQIAHKLRDKGEKSLIVFLAPKIQLVIQVSCKISNNALLLF